MVITNLLRCYILAFELKEWLVMRKIKKINDLKMKGSKYCTFPSMYFEMKSEMVMSDWDQESSVYLAPSSMGTVRQPATLRR